MELHLDLVGGLAGDMFIAALLDLFPEHEAGLHDSLARTGGLLAGVTARLVPHNDGVLAGKRFLVERPGGAGARNGDRHDHVAWRRIREGLEASELKPAVRDHAIAIFRHLAEAEARVHGVPVEAVSFHEVGAWDSIADIVGAAHLIAAARAARWTVGAIPLGSGRVRSAHGPLPVPAPATALLLQGFAVIDDGVGGERVTPTGAAILRHLCGDTVPQAPRPRILGGTGIGFGTRILPGLSNCARVLRFDAAESAPAFDTDAVLVVECEIDDQSGEELALALDRLRAHPAVLDVVQAPVFGKKGRMMAQLRLLALPEARDEVLRLCFAETTTIGLRHSVQARAVLPRRMVEVEAGGRTVRVKAVDRPGGRTAKAEADDVADLDGHKARRARRRAAEDAVEES
ncbi:LarC family nickel insertion protein [Mycobacterium sp. KBS0706]|uniref:LarC family nickel insertion protein n=1 Tax=Mycobacterium sp. KBS0706 TaxID=2578109 RepID=UPI00110FC629|nr:LarC family nickel insertion protein [Mycobacterium sp. KBS0706]TSD87224.1 LarC family nickel insertion protein [Mycobacterium sp. KBS0706]